VTEKENVQKKSGHYVLKKANSVGYRTTSNRLFSSVSAEECAETSDTLKTTKKQRLWSLQLFGVKVRTFHASSVVSFFIDLILLHRIRIKINCANSSTHLQRMAFQNQSLPTKLPNIQKKRWRRCTVYLSGGIL
jgi:hypothetical protein